MPASTADGESVYRQACALGCEAIVSKRLGSPHKPGRVEHWLKIKNLRRRRLKGEAERGVVVKAAELVVQGDLPALPAQKHFER